VQTEDGDVELGDIIVAVNGEKVGNNDDLAKTLDKYKVGETVSIEIIRRGHRTTVPVQLSEAPTRRGMRE
jgi:S1-C subfamily serine protease